MKILVIPTWHPTPAKPNWCTWILPHIKMLRDNNHNVFILQIDQQNECIGDNEVEENINLNEQHWLIPFSYRLTRFTRTRLFYKHYLDAYYKKLETAFNAVIKTWGMPDIIHSHVSLPGGYCASRLGRKYNVPVVVTEHYSGFSSDVKYPWRLKSYYKNMSKMLAGFYVVSPGLEKTVTSVMNVTGVLFNPINTEVFTIGEESKASEYFEIVTAGDVCHRKGTDVLFRALGLVRDDIKWRLVIFGSYSEIDNYRELIDENLFEERIILRGRVDQKDLVQTYQQSDLFIVSSRIETANVSMLEAMACGLPVISTKCGAPETLIDNSVSKTIPSEDPDSMAYAIEYMYDNQTNYSKKLNRKFVIDRFSTRAVYNSTITAYEKAISH